MQNKMAFDWLQIQQHAHRKISHLNASNYPRVKNTFLNFSCRIMCAAGSCL